MKSLMNLLSDPFKRITPLGDSALLLQLSNVISLAVNNRIRALNNQMKNHPMEGILEWVPGYTSLTVFYDPMVVGFSTVRDHVISCMKGLEEHRQPPPEQVMIPVRYGGEVGPDLDWLADFHGISPSMVVRLHTAQTYRVGMMGFTPGFAYLMGLNPNLATPRRSTPRTHVPVGSVGIAGHQTGIYPLESPGGWQLIGKTEMVLYNPESEKPFLLSPGAEVRFQPLAEGVMP